MRTFQHPEDIPADVTRVMDQDGWIAARKDDGWLWESDCDGRAYIPQEHKRPWQWSSGNDGRLFPLVEVS